MGKEVLTKLSGHVARDVWIRYSQEQFEITEKWELQVMICGASLYSNYLRQSMSGLSDNILAFVLWNNKHIFEVVQEMKSSRDLV